MSQETLQKTRYYEIKSDGCFFSKCPKDDNSPEVQDGRTIRHWTYGGQDGSTVGYSSAIINGMIESLWEDASEYGTFINVGVQTDDGVKVIKIEKTTKWGSLDHNAVALARVHDALQLEFPVEFSLFVGKPNKAGFSKVYLNIKQFGKPVWPTYKKVDGSNFDYEGIPSVKRVEKLGKVTYNSDEHDEFLYGKLKELMAAVDAAGHKENRGQTPAEAAYEKADSESEDLEEDVGEIPF